MTSEAFGGAKTVFVAKVSPLRKESAQIEQDDVGDIISPPQNDEYGDVRQYCLGLQGVNSYHDLAIQTKKACTVGLGIDLLQTDGSEEAVMDRLSEVNEYGQSFFDVAAQAETVADVVESEDVLLRHNDVEKRVFFVATVHGDVIGWIHINAPTVEKLAHTAELTVGVVESYQGRGIGTRLLERGVEWAVENGFEKLYNSVPSSNEGAIEFLERHGWEAEAVRENHYKLDDEYVDEVMLSKEI